MIRLLQHNLRRISKSSRYPRVKQRWAFDHALRAVLMFVVTPFLSNTIINAQCIPVETFKLLPNDSAAGDRFGSARAISGTTAIIGTWYDEDNGPESGSAYLFDTTTGKQIFKLLPNDGAAYDKFGYSVAINGTTAIVGARSDDDNGDGSGSAYLFDTTTGQQIFKLLPNDGVAGDRFGSNVAISGTTAIVGATDGSGSAYLFDTTTGQQMFKLLSDDGAAGDSFGRVAISGTTAVVGAPYDDDNGDGSGSAYIFDTATGMQIFKLLPDDGAQGDWFGQSVAISGTTAVVGARNDEDNGPDSGSAYLFDTTTGQQLFKLLPDDGAVDDDFGHSVAISGTIAIVGARNDDDNGSNSGAAYLFDTTTGQQIAKLLPDEGAAGDSFGRVAISGTTAVVAATGDDDNGENSGSAYVFEISCSEVVIPDSFTVTRGDYVAGGIVELGLSDNADLSLRRAISDIQSRTEFEVKGTSPVANPTSLKVSLEGSVFARSTVNQTIELYDYASGQWEQVDTRAATRFTDSTVTVAATGDLSRFVEPGTMCLKARIRYQSPIARQQFSSNTDQFIWSIGQ